MKMSKIFVFFKLTVEKTLAKSVYRNPSRKDKIRLLSLTGFFISVYSENHDKTDSVSKQFRKKNWI